jgi:hypothetical protein
MGQKPKFHEVANFRKSQIKTRNANCVMSLAHVNTHGFLAFAYQGKDIVFRFIIEYSSLRDFGPLGLFLYEGF